MGRRVPNLLPSNLTLHTVRLSDKIDQSKIGPKLVDRVDCRLVKEKISNCPSVFGACGGMSFMSRDHAQLRYLQAESLRTVLSEGMGSRQ